MADWILINPKEQEIRDLSVERERSRTLADRQTREANNRRRSLDNVTEQMAATNEFLNAAREMNLPVSIREALNAKAEEFLAEATPRRKELTAAINRYEREASRALDRIAQITMRIPRLEAEAFEWTPDEIKQRLVSHPNVDHNSVRFTTQGGKPWVMMRLKNLYFRVEARQNTYDFINDGGLVEVPLADIYAKIDPASGTVHFVPVRGQNDRWPMGFNEAHGVHPHVLSSDYVCAGSFGQQLINTVKSMEWLTIVDVMLAFIGKVDPSDSAGKHWPKWMIHSPAFPERRLHDFSSSSNWQDWLATQRNAGVEFWCTKEHGPMLKQEWENLREQIAQEREQQEQPVPEFELEQEQDGLPRGGNPTVIEADQEEGATIGDLIRMQMAGG